MTRLLVGTLILLGLGLAAPVAVAHQHPQAPTAPAAFEELKALAGDWEGKTPMGPFTINYRLSAGGTAVVETMFPGTTHEMVNVYHPDGDRVAMTHYCAAGNQPLLKLDSLSHSSKRGTEWHFVCASVSNLKSHDDGHMHDLVLKLHDKDHLTAVWTSQNQGKAEEPAVFTMTRKK